MFRISTAIAALAFATSGSATTFLGGTVSTGAEVVIGDVIDTSGISTTGIAAPATIAELSSVAVTNGPYIGQASTYVSGTWTSADAGSIDIQWGWGVVSGGSGLPTSVNTNLAIPNWSYTFTASGNGFFAGRYSVVGTGDTFGLQPVYGTSDMPFGPYGGDVADPTGSGNFSVALVNGQTYTMAFFNFGNVSNPQDGFDATGDARALIDWTISYNAVPEPATWAMMIAGFGLVGLAARRRRETHVSA